MRNGTDDQRTLPVGHQNPDIVGLSNLVPLNHVVGHDPVDEQRKLASLRPLPPSLLPLLDDFRNAARILPFVGSVRLKDSCTEKWRGRKLLGFAHSSRDLHLDPASGFDGDFLEIRARRLAQHPSFFRIDQDQQEGKWEEADHDDRADDFLLETI